MTCTNCTDYQARRTRTKISGQLAYTLNGTGIAIERMLIALLENHYQEGKEPHIPQALKRFL